MSRKRVAVVDLARSTAFGAQRRLRDMVGVFQTLGYEVEVISLLPGHRSSVVGSLSRFPLALMQSRVVPESVVWSPVSVRKRLDETGPDIVVCVTSRAFHPKLLGPWDLYIDFVDRLSESYLGRASISSSRIERLVYRHLSRHQRRFEVLQQPEITGRFAAGKLDSIALGAHWLKICNSEVDCAVKCADQEHRAEFDIAFIGTLDYLPNIYAVEYLAQFWPRVLSSRPGTSILIAGARPTGRIRELAEINRWELLSNFDSLDRVLGCCRIAIAPLAYASGMQIKVLDAAAYSVPQVVSPVVASGFDSQFPMLLADTEDEWASQIIKLLQEPALAVSMGQRSLEHVELYYSRQAIASELLSYVSE